MDSTDGERILSGCDEAQRAVITSPSSPLLVIAGAGAGKTRVLTRRIAWRVASGGAASGHVLALTFTRKAAGELRQRLADLGLSGPVTAGTFHSVALAELRNRAIGAGHTPPAVLDSKARLLARIITSARTGSRPSALRRDLVSGAATEIEWAKSRRIPPEHYAAQATANHRAVVSAPEEIASWYAQYEEAKARAGMLDFEDLLERLATAIQTDRTFAAVQRWRFRHLFVDELQDANAAQLRLLDAWLGERDDLFAVGDARQAIYGWNGADPSAVVRFGERYPGATVIELGTNYRSTPQVVRVASSVFGKDVTGQSAPSPDGAPPSVTAYETAAEEAAGVADAVRRRRVPGMPWSSCAVLARTNAQLTLFESALAATGVPFRSPARQSLRSRPEVRTALALLPPQGDAVAFARWLADLRDERSGADAAADATNGVDHLAQLGSEYLADTVPSAAGFLAYLDEAVREGAFSVTSDGVELLTFHRAKGLEWPVVFVTGIEAGYLPIAHARTKEAVEEERRLFYVALTRATSDLHCSWAKNRDLGGRSQTRDPSPFLAHVATTCRSIEREQRFEPDRAKAALASVRALLDASSPGG